MGHLWIVLRMGMEREGEEERWGKEVVVIWKGEGMHVIVKNGVYKLFT